MQELKQSTANQIVLIYLTDATDGYTPELEAAIIPGGTYPTCYLTKNGGAAGALTLSAANFAVISDANLPGWYKLILAAADTDTVGPLGIDVYKSTVSRHFATVVQVKANTTDEIKVDTAAILADTGTDGVVVPAATQAAIVDAVWDEATSGHTTAGTTGKALTSATAAADPWSADPASYTTDNTYGKAIARAIGGSGFTTYTLTVQNEDDVAVEGVRVDVYSSTTVSAATFVTTGTTNSSGQVTLYLRSGTYYGRRYKAGMSFAGDPVTITVS